VDDDSANVAEVGSCDWPDWTYHEVSDRRFLSLQINFKDLFADNMEIYCLLGFRHKCLHLSDSDSHVAPCVYNPLCRY